MLLPIPNLNPDHPHHRRLAMTTTVCAAVVVIFMLKGFWFIQEDDSYIFYAYAQNLANGEGYVFNPGERVNATTSPLYTLLLALFYAALRFLPFVTLPLIGHVIGAVSLFFLCYFLMRAFASDEDSIYPYAVPLVLLASPFMPRAVGMELFLSMMLGVLALYYYARERRVAAAFACALAVLGRPDMLLVAGILLLYDLARYRRLPTLRMAVVFLLPLAVWTAFSLYYFGSVVPTTYSAKLAQTEAGLWGAGPVFFRGLVSAHAWFGGSANGRLIGILMLSGAVTAAWHLRTWSLLRHPVLHVILLWNLVYLLVYGVVLKAPAYAWYYTPLALGIAVIITLAIEGIYRALVDNRVLPSALVLSVAYAGMVIAGLVFPVVGLKQPVMPTYENYRQAAEWLNDHAPTGSSVGAGDIGVLRFYYTKGTIIDYAGLVTPDIVEHLRRREFGWWIDHYRPDYLKLLYPPREATEMIVFDPEFQKQYALQKIFRTRGFGCAIYARQQPMSKPLLPE